MVLFLLDDISQSHQLRDGSRQAARSYGFPTGGAKPGGGSNGEVAKLNANDSLELA